MPYFKIRCETTTTRWFRVTAADQVQAKVLAEMEKTDDGRVELLREEQSTVPPYVAAVSEEAPEDLDWYSPGELMDELRHKLKSVGTSKDFAALDPDNQRRIATLVVELQLRGEPGVLSCLTS